MEARAEERGLRGGCEPLRLDPGLPLPLRKEHCGRIPSAPPLSCALHLTARAADTPPLPSLFGEPGPSIFSSPGHLFLLLGSSALCPRRGLSAQEGVRASDDVGLGPSITLCREESTSCLASFAFFSPK